MNKIIYMFILVVIVAGTYLISEKSLFTDSQPTVPIQAEYPDKIIYTADLSFDNDLLRRDCEKRNGTFNTCGSSCTQGEICVQVCVLTCELK